MYLALQVKFLLHSVFKLLETLVMLVKLEMLVKKFSEKPQQIFVNIFILLSIDKRLSNFLMVFGF